MEVLRSTLLRQFDSAWQLLALHLASLDDSETLWRPASVGLHVRPGDDGTWQADWPENEDYSTGPPSIAWLTWHIGFWWSMCLDHTVGEGRLTREAVPWPGTIASAREWIESLSRAWATLIEGVDDAGLVDDALSSWPFTGRPFVDVIAWVNAELMKNAAEIGLVRFLYAVRPEQ